MRNLIHKFDTGTDIEIKFYQDTNTRKFGVTEFNKSTNEYNNTEWFFNYQKATDEIKNRLRTYKPEEEKPNFKTYTMNDWKKDGKLKLQIGQYIDDEVFNQLKNNIQPRAYSRRCFQPGEVHCKSVNGEDLYHTFTMDDGWMYLGLCPGNSTTPEESINENKKYKNMKNSIKLTENEFKSLIKESVSKILNEIGNTPKGQKALGALSMRHSLKEPNCDSRNNNLKSSKISKYAEKARGGDTYDDYGNNKNSLYNDYANGSYEYLNNHPNEYLNHKKIKESIHKNLTNKLKEDFDPYDIIEWNHFDNDNFDTDYYDGFVVLDGTGANLGNFDYSEDAIEYARGLARKNKYGTYYVYGTENNEYDDDTLIYDTDQEF